MLGTKRKIKFVGYTILQISGYYIVLGASFFLPNTGLKFYQTLFRVIFLAMIHLFPPMLSTPVMFKVSQRYVLSLQQDLEEQ